MRAPIFGPNDENNVMEGVSEKGGKTCTKILPRLKGKVFTSATLDILIIHTRIKEFTNKMDS